MNYTKIKSIIEKYDVPMLEVSKVFSDGGLDPLWSRLERAVINQIEDGAATVSRYGVWANTVRDNIIEAISLSESGKPDEANALLVRAANSMSAFAEVQGLINENSDDKNNCIKDLWKKYNQYTRALSLAFGRTNNIVGEYAEYLAHQYYGGKLLKISGSSADIEDANGMRYQVKSRKIKILSSTQLNVIRSWLFNFLVVIIFDEYGSINKAIEVPVEVAKEYGKKNNHQNGWIITTNFKFMNDPRSKDITIALSEINI